MALKCKNKAAEEVPFDSWEHLEEFEFWLGCGGNFSLLAREYPEHARNWWRSIAKSHGWYGEAARRLKERYERIKEAVESDNQERAVGLIGAAYATLETAFIRDADGNIISTSFNIASATDFDRIARLILLLQGDADSHVEVNDFATLIQTLSGNAETEKDSD